jgi:hypothetical protein
MKSNDELIDRHRATEVAERKVIEAAKAWWADIQAGEYYYPVKSLGGAVEALEAAEGEE